MNENSGDSKRCNFPSCLAHIKELKFKFYMKVLVMCLFLWVRKSVPRVLFLVFMSKEPLKTPVFCCFSTELFLCRPKSVAPVETSSPKNDQNIFSPYYAMRNQVNR